MIRMVQSSSPKQAREYFNSSLRRADYYLNGQERPGCFSGRMAARLGINGPATKNTFHALCEHINPVSGEPLTQRKTANRTVGYDINFHCPKSVSILHALSADDHLLNAFEDSVQETMRDLEADAQTRVRKNGQDDDRITGELLWADFIHQTARPVGGIVPDPHLHAHCFVFNVTFDAVENKFKAGQFRDIKRDMPYYQARFHKILSDKLIGLGYRIRRTATAFEIEGVPPHIVALFSKRTNEIGQIAKDLGITDPATLDQLGARTRAKKQKGLTMTELKAEWRKQITSLGLTDKGEGDQLIRYAPAQHIPFLTPDQCVDHALAVRFERASVMQDRRILETAYRHSLGQPNVTVGQITDSFERDTRILKLMDGAKMLCTTKAVLAEEQQMVKLASQGKGTFPPLYATMPPMALDGEQGDAIAHVLTTPNCVSIIRGKAGTGKTTLMREAVRLIEATGRRVTVVAPTAQAARGVLRDEGFSEAETVAYLLASPALQAALANGVLWVDEAGLLNNADMTALLTLAIRQNARLILSGDTRQHPTIIRGDALRIINTVAGIKSAEVSRIFRQRDPAYRQAVQALSEGNVQPAFTTLNALGAIKPVDPVNPYMTLATDYVTALKRGKTAIVIAPTHHEGDRVTHAIRHKLRQAGQIGKKETAAAQLVNRYLTQAEKSDARNYQPGQIIQFNQNVTGIKRGEQWSVTSIEQSQVMLANGQGQINTLPLKHMAAFEVYQPREINLAKGDSIRITRNGLDATKRRLNNGQLLEVVAVEPTGTIRLKNTISKVSYTLPNNFGHLAYAHCITSHAAQGKTVDEVFIAQPASTFAATNLNQFYVSVSRARDRVHIYTDDAAGLLGRAAETGNRLSALELLKRKKATRRTAEHLVRNMQPTAKPVKVPPAPIKPPIQRKGQTHAPRPRL
ncbi:MobF family relaxase [Fibrella arboris]|uniref:MobF family relaxase n=1 Tax=Fibrella arboris TaxID=3242486 RepID=UPI003520AAD1